MENKMNVFRSSLLSGMAVAIAGTSMLKNKKAFGKSARKAVNAMGDIVDSVQEIFK